MNDELEGAIEQLRSASEQLNEATEQLNEASEQVGEASEQVVEASDELRQAMEQLRAICPQLNQATDEATRLIVRVEKFLNQECSLGIPTGVIMSETPGVADLVTRVELKYGRSERGLFGLYISTKVLAGQDQVVSRTAVPLLRASREEKLNSVAELPRLLAKLAQKAADMAAKAKASTQTVSRVMNAMDKK